MQKVSQSNIYKQYLGTRPLLRVYKGEEIIQNYEQDYVQPVDWFDIRTDCPKNSIALYVAHTEDYSSYDNLGFTSNCSGGYKVYIDGIQYGTTYSSGSTCSITWSSANITTGRPILTPTKLIAHKIWIVPATIGNNITAFHCDRVAASGSEEQGILWEHFNLTNSIDISYLNSTGSLAPSNYYNPKLVACTAKNNTLNFTEIQRAFLKCENLIYLPSLNRSTSNWLEMGFTFTNCYLLETVKFKNTIVGSGNYCFRNCYKLKEIIGLEYTSALTVQLFSYITNSPFLKNTILDLSSLNKLKGFGCFGKSSYFMSGFKGLRVSNEAPFNHTTAPQINVSYTGMDRAALVQLFNDLPYNVGYEVVGSPTINNGVVSGFSDNDYLLVTSTPFSVSNNVEIRIKFTPTEIAQGYLVGLHPNSAGIYLTVINNTLRYGLVVQGVTQTTAGSAYAIQELNVPYYLHYVFDVSTLNVKVGLSSDGINPTYGINITATQYPEITQLLFGKTLALNNLYLRGSIDLNETYIKINGVYWFNGKAAMTKSIDCSYCTGTSALTNADKAIVSNKNWNLTATAPVTDTIMFDVPQGSTVTVNGTDYTPVWANEVWYVLVTLPVGSSYTYTVSKPGYLSTSDSGVFTGHVRLTFISAIGTGATVDFNNSGYSKIIVPWGTEVSYTASETGYISYHGTQALTNFTEEDIHFAKLVVNIDPTPDTITINGINGDKLLFLDNTTFNYTIVANKTGYQTLTLTGTIDTDATITGTIEKAPLFESSVPGTYSLTLSEPVNCFVAVVGGGSGGGAELFSGNKGGGSGAAVYGNTTLPAGTYTIYVGDGSPKHRDSIVAAGASSIQENNSAYMITASGAQSHWSITAGLRGDLVYASDTNLTILQGNDANDMTGGASVYEGYGKGGSYNEDGGTGYVLIRSL